MPLAKSSGRSSGNWIVSVTASLTLERPPTSSHVTLGILGAPMESEKFLRAASTATSKSADVRQRARGPPATWMSRTVRRDEVVRASRRERCARDARSTTSTRSPATRAAVLSAMELRSMLGSRETDLASTTVRRMASRSASSGAPISSSWVKRARTPSGTWSTSLVVAMSTRDSSRISLRVASMRSAVRASMCWIRRAQQSVPQLWARSARVRRKPSVLTSLPEPEPSLRMS